jgi:hypothetical protein
MGLISIIKGAAKGAMGIFSSSDKAVEGGIDIVKKGMDGFDDLFYTEQEKAATSIARTKLKLKAGEGVLRFVEMTHGENSKRSITRRYMAWLIVGSNILLTFYYIFVCTVAVFWTTYNKQLVWLADRIIMALKYWGTATATVVAFYFGYYAVSNVVEKWNSHKTPPVPEPEIFPKELIIEHDKDEDKDDKHIDMSLDK